MINLLIGVLVSIPVGVGINLLTPWLKTEFATRNQRRRERRIEQIKNRYLLIERWRANDDMGSLVVNAMFYVIATFCFLIFAVLGTVFAVVGLSLRSSITQTIGSITVPYNLSPSTTAFTYTSLAAAMLSLALGGFVFISAFQLYRNIASAVNPYRKVAEKSLWKLGSHLPDVASGDQGATAPLPLDAQPPKADA
jgi:hypothetical protein